MRNFSTTLILAAAISAGATTAHSAVVYEDSFNTSTRVTGTGTDIYTIQGSSNWYTFSPSTSTVDVSDTVGNPVKGIVMTDTGSGAGYMSHNLGTATAFDGSQAATGKITFSVDMRVDAYTSGSGQSNFRMVLKDGGRTNPFFVAGFTRGTGADESKLFLYAGDTGSTSNNYFSPTVADAIGYNANTSSFASDFDFGIFSSTSTNNDTNDEFYRLAVTFNPAVGGSQTIDITATRLSNSSSATLTKTVATPYVFSNDSSDIVTLYAPGSATGTAYFDNVKVEAVPEPTALSLIGIGATALLRRR